MENTLIGLLLIALALGGVAVFWFRIRLNRLEEELRDFRALSLLPDRLNALVKAVDAFDREEILHEIARIQEAVDRVESLAVASPSDDAPNASRAEVVKAIAIRWLRAEEYIGVQIGADEDDMEEEDVEVPVRAVRNGVLVQGRLHIRGDDVVEADLEPSYTAFP
jgi:uncharacterized protein HemX